MVLLLQVLHGVYIDSIVHPHSSSLVVWLIGLCSRFIIRLFRFRTWLSQPKLLIILLPALLVDERLIGLFDFSEALFVAATVHIWMIDLGKFDEVFFNVLGGGGGWYLKQLIVGTDFVDLREAESQKIAKH